MTDYVLWALGNLMDTPPLVVSTDGTYDGIAWMDIAESKRPSREKVEAEIARIQTVVQPTDEYRKNRALSYPSIGDQLDALFHAGVFPPEMAQRIQSVKDEFPKPDANI
jgi:hypothetical protein